MSRANGPRPPKSIENTRLGYQTAIDLMTHEGQLAWAGATAFGPLLVLLLAGAVLERLPFVQDAKVMSLINVLASLVGASASYLWWSATARSRRVHKYWIACARDFEANLDGIKTLTKGKLITEEEQEGVTAGGEKHLLKFPERHSHTFSFGFLYIICFLIFVLLTIMNFALLAQHLK